jgi:hypothetical protein
MAMESKKQQKQEQANERSMTKPAIPAIREMTGKEKDSKDLMALATKLNADLNEAESQLQPFDKKIKDAESKVESARTTAAEERSKRTKVADSLNVTVGYCELGDVLRQLKYMLPNDEYQAFLKSQKIDTTRNSRARDIAIYAHRLQWSKEDLAKMSLNKAISAIKEYKREQKGVPKFSPTQALRRWESVKDSLEHILASVKFYQPNEFSGQLDEDKEIVQQIGELLKTKMKKQAK